MNYYLFINVLSVFFTLFGGVLVFNKYRNPAGLFFFSFTIFISLWFIFYIIFFSGIQDTNLLLYISRIDFGVGVLLVYSLLFFIYYFSTKPSKILTKQVGYIFIAYVLLLILYIGTDLIIESITFDPSYNAYREVYGKGFFLELLLHFLCLVLFVYTSVKQINRQILLNRTRLKHILSAAFALVFTVVFFQLILPAFGIWILEKEIVLTLPIFALYINYVINRWYFPDRGIGVGKFMVIIFSIGWSIFLLNLTKTLYIYFSDEALGNYWITNDYYSIIDTVLGIGIFSIAYLFLRGRFLGNTEQVALKNKFQSLRGEISRTKTFEELNESVSRGMNHLLKIKLCEIRIFEAHHEISELQRYFESDLTRKMFINDIVFLEEKKNKFNKELVLKELPEDAFLVLPLFNRARSSNTGIVILGVKPFGDSYSSKEIEVIAGFLLNLEIHIKYIHTYEQINELTINLDKKVDEKTIEYNNLINQQKEFIGLISHEIKSPIANAIFQADSLLDDIEAETISRDEISEQLRTLNTQLIHVGDLTSKLFSVQYFDIHAVSLFKEKVQIGYMLQTEFDVYSRVNKHIQFINQISNTIGFISVDRIQFQQVIANILGNAIKFLDKKNSVIIVEAFTEKGFLHVIIEDNGRGFIGIDIESLFDKYTTGGTGSVGLGMGLYLCKKIVEMHSGEITASLSEKIGGAKFIIKIPVE